MEQLNAPTAERDLGWLLAPGAVGDWVVLVFEGAGFYLARGCWLLGAICCAMCGDGARPEEELVFELFSNSLCVCVLAKEIRLTPLTV